MVGGKGSTTCTGQIDTLQLCVLHVYCFVGIATESLQASYNILRLHILMWLCDLSSDHTQINRYQAETALVVHHVDVNLPFQTAPQVKWSCDN